MLLKSLNHSFKTLKWIEAISILRRLRLSTVLGHLTFQIILNMTMHFSKKITAHIYVEEYIVHSLLCLNFGIFYWRE